MKTMRLVLTLITTTLHAPKPSPAIELFLIEPSQTLKVVDTVKGEWLDSEVVLTPACATQLATFTQRNVGKQVVFALLRTNQNGTHQTIDLGNSTWVDAPITNGVLHLHTINPPHFDRKIQDHPESRDGSTVAAN